jgi:putative DNA methylase
MARGGRGGDLVKRFIEVDFPIRVVSEHSAREKYTRHGHISTLHIWWARRPLAASRASIYAALIPAPADERERLGKEQFIGNLCQWENSLNPHVIKKAQREILDANGGQPPRVLDCFAGGGAIPLEALRLGCETHALELNPVAVLILKATLEYPQKFSNPNDQIPKAETRGQQGLPGVSTKESRLMADVRRWGEWVLEEVRKELAEFYPPESDGSLPVGYIWARTVRCQNPACGAEIPLMRQFWLAKKKKKRIALRPVVDRKHKRVDFEVVEGKAINFDPAAGTVRRAKVTCPICGAGMDANTLRLEFRQGQTSQRMVAVVLHHPNRTGKTYRLATGADVEVFHCAEAASQEKLQTSEVLETSEVSASLPPVPDEPLPPVGTLGFRVQRYGLLRWVDLFNPRQKLALITFVEKVRRAHEEMLAEGYDLEYANAVVTYLALGVDMAAAFGNTLARWENTSEAIKHAFGRQALPMLWDYAEVNPFSGASGSWETGWEYYLKVLEHCTASIQNSHHSTTVWQGTATRLPYPDDYFDAVVTDPPYYDNVPYADLSDFFYVWLKRTVGHLYPDLFATPLTPKSLEIIEDEIRHGKDRAKAHQFFEEMLTRAFEQIKRVLKPRGIAVIVFAHKSTEAWETIIQGLLKTGLVLNASWPVHTEMRARLRGQASGAMASSFYMVCRKRAEERVAYFNEIRPAIEGRIREKLEQFWNEGIGGADFFISAIGPAVEVFGQYARVERLSGEEVTVRELLEFVRRTVSEFALERILKSPQLGGVDTETRFYLLWRWTYNNLRAHFDDARKLAQAVGVELTEHWGRGGFIKKEKEYIRVMGPKERESELMERKTPVMPYTAPLFEIEDGGEVNKHGSPPIMIDVLHRCLLLWERSDRKAIGELLMHTGYGGRDIFWQVAQAISDVLPEGSKERQLLQGFLYGRREYQAAARTEAEQLGFDFEGGLDVDVKAEQ